ncbi:dual specificity protein phosphatase 13-like [Corvus cornix cornix]|nr:dual specificity protein phosphatase 13-like [Corvus cornix cornix]
MNAQISLSATAVSETRLGTVTASVGGGQGAVPLVADVPRTKAAVWQSSAALETRPEKQIGAAAVPVGAAQRRAASAGVGAPGHRSAGTAWLPDTCAGPSRTERGWQRPSARRERRLALDLSMSAAEAPDTQDPDGVGTLPEDVPSLKEIEQLLNTGRPSCNHVDEVWPNLFLGDLVTAHNRFVLWKMGVTHVLNAAHGTAYSHGGQDFYGATIDYYGVPAHDLPSFDISQFFFSAAQFIHNALSTPGAKILVHCAVGVSRSASLVLAYLMINHHLPLVEAIKTVKEHRWISPNRGFLKHLRNLDVQLRQRKDC